MEFQRAEFYENIPPLTCLRHLKKKQEKPQSPGLSCMEEKTDFGSLFEAFGFSLPDTGLYHHVIQCLFI